MFQYLISHRLKIIMAWILLICFMLCNHANSQNIITLKQIKPDNACGPRCLWAIMQITKAGKPDCGIKCIYELIGQEPFTATNFNDLKDAAQKLGFSAKGYKLAIKDLKKINGYIIVPIGNAAGTALDPWHFILVKQVTEDYIIIIDTKTLKSQALVISEFQQLWKGYALVIAAGHGMETMCQSPDENESLEIIKSSVYDQIKDFGPVDSGSRLEHTFTIPGKTNKAKIVSKSCSCLSAKLGNDTSGNSTITLELHVDKTAWQEAYAAVLLEPEGIIQKYALRAYGKDSFRITPAIGLFEAPNGGLVEYPVRIDYFTGSDDIIKYDHMKSDIPNLKVISVKESSITKGDATTFSFEIPLIFDAGENPPDAKNIGGTVSFILNTGDGDRTIPLKLTVQVGADKYKLNPERVFIIASKSAAPKPQKAKIDFLTSACPANITISSDNNLPLEINTNQTTDSSYMIEIGVSQEKLKDLAPGLHKSKISIIPKGLPDIGPIALPVSLFVRE